MLGQPFQPKQLLSYMQFSLPIAYVNNTSGGSHLLLFALHFVPTFASSTYIVDPLILAKQYICHVYQQSVHIPYARYR